LYISSNREITNGVRIKKLQFTGVTIGVVLKEVVVVDVVVEVSINQQ
jgi:hypothetical protein